MREVRKVEADFGRRFTTLPPWHFATALYIIVQRPAPCLKKLKMVLRMWKCGKKPSPLRNAAVQTVGETYFFLGMAGMVIAGVLAIATVASGKPPSSGVVSHSPTGLTIAFRSKDHSRALMGARATFQSVGGFCLVGDNKKKKVVPSSEGKTLQEITVLTWFTLVVPEVKA